MPPSVSSAPGGADAASDNNAPVTQQSLEQLRQRVKEATAALQAEEAALKHAKHAAAADLTELAAAAAAINKAMAAVSDAKAAAAINKAMAAAGLATRAEWAPVPPSAAAAAEEETKEEEIPTPTPPVVAAAAASPAASSSAPPHANYHFYCVKAPRGVLGLWFNDQQAVLKINPMSPLLVGAEAAANSPSVPRKPSGGLGGVGSPRARSSPGTSTAAPQVKQPRPRVGDKLVLINGASVKKMNSSQLANALVSSKDKMRLLVFMRGEPPAAAEIDGGVPKKNQLPNTYTIFAPRGRLGLAFDNNQCVSIIDKKTSPFQAGVAPAALSLGDRLTTIDGVPTDKMSPDVIAQTLLARITDDHRALDFVKPKAGAGASPAAP